jgi:hypothetical protein
MRTAGVNCRRRFLEHCGDYIEAVSKEAEYRERDVVLNMEQYEALRRENSAVRLCFMLAMFALDVDLPDEVFEDSAFVTIYFAACDLVCWANVGGFCSKHRCFKAYPSIIRIYTVTTWNSPRAIAATIFSPY